MEHRQNFCLFQPVNQRRAVIVIPQLNVTQESERLLRLPLFYNLSAVNQRTVINSLLSYFSVRQPGSYGAEYNGTPPEFLPLSAS
jgi:hypothetical protein